MSNASLKANADLIGAALTRWNPYRIVETKDGVQVLHCGTLDAVFTGTHKLGLMNAAREYIATLVDCDQENNR